jgi:hypothetical protein
MAAVFEFVDIAGAATIAIAQRRNNCITVGPWVSGAQSVATVIVENVGDASGVAGVQFYLQTGSGLKALQGQLGTSGLNPGNSMAVVLTYIPQGADSGEDTLYAQIQSGPGPFPSPTDMSQAINASKQIDVLVGKVHHPRHAHPHAEK